MEGKDSITVFIKLSFDSKNRKFKNLASKSNWGFDYRINNSYESKNGVINGYAHSKRIFAESNKFVFSFNVPKPESSSAYLFVVVYEDEEEGFIQDIPLRVLDKNFYSKNAFFQPEFNIPIFNTFINRRDSILVKTSESLESIPVNFYKYNFQPALPPFFATNTYDNEVRLSKDSSYVISKDSITSFKKRGVYTLGAENVFQTKVFVTDNRFPKVSKTKELIDATIYIASDDERKRMKSSKPKARLDEFWLDLAEGDKEFARKMIKKFYYKIEMANTYFTNYKEGWKTDQGMVYILFGMPDEVFRNDVKETWNYKRRPNIPSIRFVFDKKLSPFGDHYYQLQNSEEYTQVWYSTVELWRKGILDR